MNRLVLVDAYALIYRSYYAFIKNPRINSKGMNTSAVMGFCNTLHEVLTKESPTHIAVAFDPAGPTFRHDTYPAYKAQREACPEDIRASVPVIKEILEAYGIAVVEAAGYEADDVIGTLARKAAALGDTEVFMLTPDKDYGQLVDDNIRMMRPKHGSGGYDIMGPEEITAKYGIGHPSQMIDLLGLMGDAADNIPGCPGVGEKTAQKLIAEFGTTENLIAATDRLKGALKKKVEDNTEQIALSKFLATIKTDAPVEADLDTMAVREPDSEKLGQIFDRLEFKSFADRILNRSKKKVKSANIELDLFSDIPDQREENAEKGPKQSANNSAHDYKLIDTEEGRSFLCDFLLTKPFVSLDTETTSTCPMEAELVGLSFSVEETKAFYVPVPADRAEAEKIVALFKPVYENPATLKIGQNLKYDMVVLANYGAVLAGPMFDTMIAHYVIQPELHHNMDYLAEIYLNYSTIRIEQLIGPKGRGQKNMRDLDPKDVTDYAAEDADITLRLKNVLEGELKRYGAESLFYDIEMPLMPVLARMELNGVRLNTESLAETSAALTARMVETEENIYRQADCRFNISSPKQVGEVLFDKLRIVEKARKTKTGQYVTSEEVLQELKGKHPIVADILTFRGLKKLLSTYVDNLPTLINSRTGHIHTQFNQSVTATGRLSSSDPNLQNIPVRGEDGKEIRKAFVPEEGCLFFSADYSQIELRVMAHLSGDENMTEAFREGHDIHAATAAKIYKESIGSVSRDQRTKAKRANFGIIYGITVFGLAERLDISRGEAKALIDGYFESFPKVHAYMEKAKDDARSKGYAETLFGRRRYLPDINSRNNTVKGFAERNAINAPIQGTAADIIKVAMIRIDRRFREENLKSKMILQVHDELNFSVVPEEKERVESIVIGEMQRAFPMAVPLVADCGWGANWLEAH